MKPNRHTTCLLLASLAALGSPLNARPLEPEAQPHATPEPAKPRAKPQADPSLTDPSIDDDLNSQRRSRTPQNRVPATPAKPVQSSVPTVPEPAIPGLRLTDRRLPARRMYPEGTFLAARPGQMVRTPAHDLVFIPEPASGAMQDREPPMLLLACLRTSQLSGAMARDRSPATLSGQVFVYRDRHYILPSAFSLTPPIPPTPEAGSPNGQAPDDEGTVRDADDPRVQDLIADLERDQGPARALDPVTGHLAPAAGADGDPEAVSLLPEGTLFVARRGRLTRLAHDRGRIAFAFDNDSNSRAGAPMMILPCRMLQSLELLAATRGEDMVLRMSGRVTAFEGRNYLLPTLFQVVAPGDITPMQ